MKEKCDEPVTCAVVSIHDMLFNVLSIKKKALIDCDWELYWMANNLEHDLTLLLDKNNIFERG